MPDFFVPDFFAPGFFDDSGPGPIGTVIIYTPYGTSSPVTLALPGPNFEDPSGYVNGDEIGYAKDGTLHAYRLYRKRHKVLKWEYLNLTNKRALEAVYYAGTPFSFSDAVDPDNAFAACYFVSEPQITQFAKGFWSCEAEIREV